MANYKLTPHQVDSIKRERRIYGTTYRELADKFHVHLTQIHRICVGLCHVKPRTPFVTRKQKV
jgi:predicted transcriptional regulator